MLLYLLAGLIFFYYHLNVLSIFAGLFVPRKYSSGKSASVTAVISAHNEEKVIEKTLKQLSALHPKPEIIVVDDASTDNTYSIAKKYATVIRNKTSIGKALSLNKAIKKANGEFIYVLDADTLVNKHTIKNLVDAMDEKHHAAHGCFFIYNKNNFTEKAGALEIYAINILKFGLIPNISNMFSGKNFLIRADVIKKLKFEHALTDDINLSARFLLHGYTLKFVPDSVATEQTPVLLSHYVKQQERWFKGASDEFVKLFKKGNIYHKFITVPYSLTSSLFVNIGFLMLLALFFPLPRLLFFTFLSGGILGLITAFAGLVKLAEKNDLIYVIPCFVYLLVLIPVFIANALYLKITHKNLKWFRPKRI